MNDVTNDSATDRITGDILKQHIVVLFGPPAAGKGTQAAAIKDMLNITHISTGDMIRAVKAKQKGGETLTPVEEEAVSAMDSGALVQDSTIIGMLLERIAEDDCKKGFLLDGFPRTPAQGEALDKALSGAGSEVSFVINIEVPDAELETRVAKRRSDAIEAGDTPRDDDDPSVFAERLVTYHEQTSPTLGYYNDVSPEIVYDIAGVGKVEDITASIRDVFTGAGVKLSSAAVSA